MSLEEQRSLLQEHEGHLLRRQLPELTITPVEGGWQVRETEHYFIQVIRMGANQRIVTVPKAWPEMYERGWCYNQEALTAVILRCQLFDPDQGEEPVGWVKEAGTERRGCAWYYRSTLKAHRGYDPECMDCGNELLS